MSDLICMITTNLKICYLKIDNIVDEIAKVCKDVLLYTLDTSQDFRNLWIDPRDLQWSHNYYADRTVALTS